MRLLSYDEFVKEPPGTIFSFVDDDNQSTTPHLRGLHRLNEVLTHYAGERPADFHYTNLVPQLFDWSTDNDKLFWGERWGEFSYEDMFMVLEPHEVAELVGLLRGNG